MAALLIGKRVNSQTVNFQQPSRGLKNPWEFFESKIMTRRNEYIVTLSAEIDGVKTMRVFADDITNTSNGDLIFGQVREKTLHLADGGTEVKKTMEMVLMLAAGKFLTITLVNKNGGKLCEESGLISSLVQ